MVRPRTLAAVGVLAGVALGTAASPAPAAVCDQDLIDGQGFGWSLRDDGHAVGPGAAGFDDLGGLEVDLDSDGTFSPYAGMPDGCAEPEEGGREIVFPEQTLEGGGLVVSRKVYVPASGPGFIRWLDIIHNATGGYRSLGVELRGNAETSTDLRVTGTSSGDLLMTAADAWVTRAPPWSSS